jgi:hypothetical protein
MMAHEIKNKMSDANRGSGKKGLGGDGGKGGCC